MVINYIYFEKKLSIKSACLHDTNVFIIYQLNHFIRGAVIHLSLFRNSSSKHPAVSFSGLDDMMMLH